MTNLEAILSEWTHEMSKNSDTYWRSRMLSGQVTLAEYKGFLRETYFQAGFNPQVQAMATAFFSREEKAVAKKFYKHASSEVGHDLMALSDLKSLGVDTSMIPQQRPLAETIALTSFPFYQIQFANPVGYLGYLFHLEYLPTQNGPNYIEMLKSLGIPEKAMTFLKEHASIDLEHNKMMEEYIQGLIKNKSDLEEVIYCAKTTCTLHNHMLDAAFKNGAKIFS